MFFESMLFTDSLTNIFFVVVALIFIVELLDSFGLSLRAIRSLTYSMPSSLTYVMVL